MLSGGYPDKTSENMGWSTRCGRGTSVGAMEKDGDTPPYAARDPGAPGLPHDAIDLTMT
ncbi:hypothetical protein GCM10029978_012090 [Actinoallomurus acanthiterrae]